ncbi:MAG: hypothetical protein PVH75_06745, partial [Syntrophobacterales bacterium]
RGLHMKIRLVVFLLVPVILLTLCPQSSGLVDWDVKKTLKIEKTPVDVAVSLNGRWVFVLTAQGSILIYSGDGRLEDEITVGKHVDGIKVGPEQDILLLTSRKNKTVEILVLDFIQNIDVSNSPFKGPADAAVTIAVFSDFQ